MIFKTYHERVSCLKDVLRMTKNEASSKKRAQLEKKNSDLTNRRRREREAKVVSLLFTNGLGCESGLS